ncbi:MAG TPA: NPCBM/NEW2 domain-containing protein [Phycisphaerae bacterium]|nr:NPCBM/NEW2 domain-containing protein [Phycisphaerae bacterium]
MGRAGRWPVLALIAVAAMCVPACLNAERSAPQIADSLPAVAFEPEFVQPQASLDAAWTDSMPPRPEPVIVTQTQPAIEPPPPPPARVVSADPPAILQMNGQDFVALLSATLQVDHQAVPCRILPEPAASQPSGLEFRGKFSFRLIPDDPRLPVCRCEVNEEPDQITIMLHSPRRTVELQIVAETLLPMLPVCLNPRESDRVMNAALGPVTGDWFDGLFMPERDWAVHLQGMVHCEELPDRVRLTVAGYVPAGEPALALALRREDEFLRTRHGLTGYAPLHRRRRELMPAAWMPLETGQPPRPDEIARNTVWMAINLQPYGAASVLLPGMQSMLPAVRTAAVPSSGTPGTRPADGTAGATGRSAPSFSAWECFQQIAESITSRFWGHGLLAQSMSSTVLVGDPLNLEQARLYASLLGLAGESPIACERMYALPDERIELLRRIIPAAPVRAVDLFAHPGLPPVWNLSVVNGAGRSNILGLFNTSDEPRMESIELADLHLGNGTQQFAVYDFWERRLLRIVHDRFQVRVPATGCRVVSIHELNETAPTVLGTSRHITCGGVDLHDVRWNEEELTLSGQSEVVANDPYELLLYVPEGPESVELLAIESETAGVRNRAHGPLRIITFESHNSGPLAWRIRFHRVSQPPQPPPPRPRQLAAVQNTRGVLLSWHQPDDRVVAHRIYRSGRFVAEVDGCEFQDSTALYNAEYEYTVTAVDFSGRESTFSEPLLHRTPMPASTNLSQLVPLSISQDRLRLGHDRSAAGTPLRIAGQRFYRGLGTTAPSRLVYFLGGGYDAFSGSVGIDDAAGGEGSAVFRIIADGQTLFTSPVIKGGSPPLPFNVRVRGKLHLELVVTDAGDGNASDYANWANAYLRAGLQSPDESETVRRRGQEQEPVQLLPIVPASGPDN